MTDLRSISINHHSLALTLPSQGGSTGGGGGPTGGGGTPGTLPSFSLQEWSGASSAPFARVGMGFAKGDVPSGYIPSISGASGALFTQLDQRTVWSDGSLRFGVAHIRDVTNFTANEARTYTMAPLAGSFNNTGILTLAGVLAGTDFKVKFSNTKNYNDGGAANQIIYRASGSTDTLPGAPVAGIAKVRHYTQGTDYTISGSTITWSGGSAPSTNSGYSAIYLSGAFSDLTHGSGSFTASLNAHITTATRITKIHSGPVCEGWVIWGMARDDTGGVDDQHLKVYWYVDAWKNANGSIYAVEIAAVIALDWWSITNKFELDYDAAFMDGATTIQTYSAVEHPYGSWWITCRTDADNNRGRRHWRGGAIPTLLYKPDRTYLIKSGLFPVHNLTVTPTAVSGSLLTYTPCRAGPTGIDGNEQGVYHRVSIDGTGAYLGRGILDRSATNAILMQDPLETANARVNGLSGLGVPNHRRSSDLRTRPGENSDTSSTIIPQKFDSPTRAAGWDDCTADGMPASVYAYADGRNSSTYNHGYVFSGSGDTTQAYSPAGVWSVVTQDASHAAAYSYGMYLLEGENYHLEAHHDHTSWLAYQNVAVGYSIRGLLLYGDAAYSALSIPNVTYSGLPGIWKPSNQRAIGWALSLLGTAAGITPTTHPAYNYFQKWLTQTGDWIATSMQYMPASQKGAGAFYPNAGYDGTAGQGDIPPWFTGIGVLGGYHAFRMTGDTRFRDYGDMVANLPIGLWASGRNYINDQYHAADRPKATDWAAGSNEFYAPGNFPAHNFNGSVTDHVNGILSFEIWEGGGQNQAGGGVSMANGDQWSPSSSIAAARGLTIPTELTEGRVYYVRDLTVTASAFGFQTNVSFKLETSPGAGAITYSANSTSSFGAQWWPQDAVHAVCSSPPYIFPADSYGPIMAAALEMAKACGNAAATDTIVNAQRTFMAPVPSGGWTPWSMKAP